MTSVDAKIPNFDFKAEGKNQLSEELKSELIYYGKKVVNSVQIEKLSKIITILAEDIFIDTQQKTYILIDRLDENWVEDELRYKLIRALIETVKKFRCIRPIKIIVTLRTDLLNRVLDKTRDSGFQREKYESLFLYISWNEEQLKRLIDKRVNHLLKCRYNHGYVCFDDIFPTKINGTSSFNYILERTFMRPRDVIFFVNTCFSEAQEKKEITNSGIILAEKKYSLDRLESLKYEWFVEHPHLNKYLDILYNREKNFKVNAIGKPELEPIILQLIDFSDSSQDSAVILAKKYFDSSYPQTDLYLIQFRSTILFILYKIGIIGIKVDGSSSVRWIHDRTQDLTIQKILLSSNIYIHKMLWRALTVDKRN